MGCVRDDYLVHNDIKKFESFQESRYKGREDRNTPVSSVENRKKGPLFERRRNNANKPEMKSNQSTKRM